MKTIIACVPLTWPYVAKDFFKSALDMTAYAFGRYDFKTMFGSQCYLHTMRESLADEALSDGANYILWLDADQTYPADTPERLMKHDKFVVGGMTPRKDDGTSLVFDLISDKARRVHLVPNRGLQKVEAMGMGGVLVDTKVFSILKPPYFLPTWKDGPTRMGEDFAFYKNCKDACIDVWCDTDLRYEHIVTTTVQVKND